MHTDTLGVRGSSGNTSHMLSAGKEAVPSQALLTSPDRTGCDEEHGEKQEIALHE